MNRSNKNSSFTNNSGFNQSGYRLASYAEAAENTDFTFAAEQSVNAVVHIKSVVTPSPRNRGRSFMNPFDFFFGDGSPYSYQQQRPRVGFGSGVIISNDGYIVTNNHVIEGADEIEVITNNDQTYKAKLVGKDETTDIALLKIEGNDFHILPFGDSDALKVGQWVLAIGNPFNLTSTVTAGIVSAKSRGEVFYENNRGGSPQDRIQSYIQTDAAVNPGNSGGALVNTKGELIGINTAIFSQTGNFVGYSFAIPINIVKKVVSDIKQYGIVQRAYLGISISELPYLKEEKPEVYEKLKVHEGVYVNSFPSNSSAQKAGIKEGDVITAINGTKIKNYQDLRAQLSRYNPGNKVNVQVQRGSEVKTVSVELKNDLGTTEVIKQQTPKGILGASFKELSKEAKARLGINYGVEVIELTDGKLKSRGIKNGFIILSANDNRISAPEDLEIIVENLLKKDPDDRGLYIKGFYPDYRKIEYFAIDLNNQIP
jgi:Do/DeqQ family serine protease